MNLILSTPFFFLLCSLSLFSSFTSPSLPLPSSVPSSPHVSAHVHHVYQLSAHPTHPSSLISAASGNNEVSVWDMETATRRQMLWASPAQPFGAMTDNVNELLHLVLVLRQCESLHRLLIWKVVMLHIFCHLDSLEQS